MKPDSRAKSGAIGGVHPGDHNILSVPCCVEHFGSRPNDMGLGLIASGYRFCYSWLGSQGRRFFEIVLDFHSVRQFDSEALTDGASEHVSKLA